MLPGKSVRLVGNTLFGLIVVSFVLPWAVAQRWPNAAGLAGPSSAVTFQAGTNAGIPTRVMQALQSASQIDCKVPWFVLGGLSKVESDHANNGALDAQGNTTSAIFGPQITWLGTQARGPFQFIPSSWELFGQGGNPDNIDDSAAAAARHICASAGGKTDEASLRKGIFGYNHSEDYVNTVMAWARQYSATTVQPATKDTRNVLGDVAAFYVAQSDNMRKHNLNKLAYVSNKFGSFWGWIGHDKPSMPAQWAAPPSTKGANDPACPGRWFTPDGRFHVPPGSTTPEMTASVARALRARFGVESSMLRAVADRSASDGAAMCSDHLWGGALDTDAVVVAWVKPWEGKIFRFITNDYADGHTHISMNPNVDTRQLQDFLLKTCQGVTCSDQSWEPPAQYSLGGSGSLQILVGR